jgi:MoaA/NifB/PqqE/SkfB family radical SAM enzyme
VDIIRQIKSASYFTYTGIITKGDMLNMDKAKALYSAGIDQIAISLDFLGDRHSENRGVNGLWDHVSELIPQISSELKRTISINTIIMDDNLDEIVDMAKRAKEWGANISFSSYSVMKANNEDHFISDETKKVSEVIKELVSLKKHWKDTIVSSEYYLEQVPLFFENGYGPPCNAGFSFLTATPDGHIKRCSEMPAVCHYTDYTPDYFTKTKCTTCWFGCRGETQAPVIAKGRELIGI